MVKDLFLSRSVEEIEELKQAVNHPTAEAGGLRDQA